jgi:ribosomal protein L20
MSLLSPRALFLDFRKEESKKGFCFRKWLKNIDDAIAPPKKVGGGGASCSSSSSSHLLSSPFFFLLPYPKKGRKGGDVGGGNASGQCGYEQGEDPARGEGVPRARELMPPHRARPRREGAAGRHTKKYTRPKKNQKTETPEASFPACSFLSARVLCFFGTPYSDFLSFFPGKKYQYRDRRAKKRDARALWIQQINAGCRHLSNEPPVSASASSGADSGSASDGVAAKRQGREFPYSRLIFGLSQGGVMLNRKVLAELAKTEPRSFRAVAHAARDWANAAAQAQVESARRTQAQATAAQFRVPTDVAELRAAAQERLDTQMGALD